MKIRKLKRLRQEVRTLTERVIELEAENRYYLAQIGGVATEGIIFNEHYGRVYAESKSR